MDHVGDVAGTVVSAYGLQPVEVTPIPVDAKRVYYRVTDGSGRQWFAKICPDLAALQQERDAAELAEYARAGDVPVPGVRRTRAGTLVADTGRLPMSLWQYVADAETAEGGLTGRRWQTVGAVVGRLHRHLADHPAAVPTVRAAAGVCDIERSRMSFDRLITAYRGRVRLGTYEAWALEVAEQRRALLDRLAAILSRLPELTVQIVHGDLASPNILLRGDEVAAVIDFWPPMPRYVSWEIARIGCDPRTVLAGDQWVRGLPELLAAYREENPAARLADLVSSVAVGCVWTLASAYTLVEPLDRPGAADASLLAYGRARHDAAVVVLDRLDEVQEMLRDHLR
jgi:Phosphotransferase enzyme family